MRISSLSANRSVLIVLAVLVALLAVWPMLHLIVEAFRSTGDRSLSLSVDWGKQITGSLQLLIGTAIAGSLIGTANGWLLLAVWLRV